MSYRVISSCAVSLALLTAAVGCGTSPGETIHQSYGGTKGLEAPKGSSAIYPAGPYGVRVGDTVADASFLGYASADDRELHPVSFHDFYDPDGSKNSKVLYFSIAALWCQPCNVEAGDLGTIVEDMAPKGYVFMQMLDAGETFHSLLPATEDDLNTWYDQYSLPFPIVLDPAKKLRTYFDSDGIPFSMIVATDTMKILASSSGYVGSDPSQSAAAQQQGRITAYEAELMKHLK